MAKSHAQRQKEYRERKKADHGSNWLENESKRTKAYYKKVSELSESAAAKRRKFLRKKQAAYRARKKEAEADVQRQKDININIREPEPSTSQCNNIQLNEVSSSNCKMVVKLDYKRRAKDRVSSKGRKRLKYLEQVKKNLEKNNQKLRKSISRLKQKLTTSSKKSNCTTPRSLAEKDMREAGIRIDKNSSIKKKLIFANCLIKQIKDNVPYQDRRGRSVLKQVVAGSILRKYRLKQYAANTVGVRIKRQKFQCNKEIVPKVVYKKIRDFLEREDNSRQLPGKADTVRNEKRVKVQKYVLNDYLRNIYLKFKAESPEEKVSFATFCRARPKHVTLVNYAARVICLCTKHQNVALKLKCLKRYGITSNTSPDSFSENFTREFYEKLENTAVEKVQYKRWKRVKCEDGKQRTKLLDMEQTKNEFKEKIEEEFEEFRCHAYRVKTQYQSFKEMKERLQTYQDHVCVQMDFAENYGIKEMEEVQSAYWNQESVTIHPVVVYYHDGDKVTHASMIAISEVLNHNTAMVHAIIEKVIKFVKRICPVVKYIHYWTDSPTSQYRNKIIFDMITQHQTLYELKASWHFFEAGHGKGACDGIGGVVKRSADTALKSGNISITNGKDFYEWGVKSGSKIKY